MVPKSEADHNWLESDRRSASLAAIDGEGHLGHDSREVPDTEERAARWSKPLEIL